MSAPDGVIDLRSDTVTRPTESMRAAMAAAPVGDDVYGEDPTVNRLERLSAETLGTESALFVPSGTQSNLLALISHCERGDEYIVGQEAHTYKYEGGGAAVLGSIQPQPIAHEPDGSLDLGRVAAAIKDDDFHFARSRLLCLENTIGGKVLPMVYIAEAGELARDRGLGFHLDGARIFNAAVTLGISASGIAGHFDSISFCLSKGLGAPVGSVLCGNREFIETARRWRKVLGGGMRQAGIVAAAGIVALEQHVDRLAEDHCNARRLAEGLAGLPGLGLSWEEVQTNMVFIDVAADRSSALESHLAEAGILVSGRGRYRLVTHLDISAADIDRVVGAFRRFLG
jgi:threonine aldolase